MHVYTIGFTRKKAAVFFGLLQSVGVKRLLDVRLNNVSQLAGFTKRDDLEYFLREIAGIEYVHEPRLAPTQEMLDEWKNQGGSWAEYEKRFLALMAARRIETTVSRELFSGLTVLLCSEPTADQCHRRLVLEHLAHHWSDLRPIHL